MGGVNTTQLLASTGDPIEQPVLVRGYVSTIRPAPLSFSEPVWVIVPGYSTDRPLGPCEWPAIHGSSLPLQGAECVVGFDDQHKPTLVWWAGSGVNVLERGIRADGTDNTAAWLELIAGLPATGTELFFPAGRYVGSFVVEGLANLTIRGAGSSSVLLNKTAGMDALKCIECPDLLIDDIRVQGTAGTRDGLHLEGCQRANVKAACGGTGRAMIWAQKCVGIVIDTTGLSVFSGPYSGEIGFPQSGLVLTWDGSDVTSGCNQFAVIGGEYIVGQTPQSSANTVQYAPGWAIQVIRAEGGTFTGPISELSCGGLYMQFCQDIVVSGDYGELNPSSITYETGTVSVIHEGTEVVGIGTEWKNTPVSPELANGAPGKYLIGPLSGTDMSFAKIATLTDNTHLHLAAENELLHAGYWPGETQSGISYKIAGADLFLDNCLRITVKGTIGTGILLRASSQCVFDDATCECIYLDANSGNNKGRIITNRTSTSGERIIDANSTNNNNLFNVINYQTGLVVQEMPLSSYTTSGREKLLHRQGQLIWNRQTAKMEIDTGTEWE